LILTNIFVKIKAMPVKPTEAELTILCVLWDHGPLPVRAIQKVLNEAKRTGYTTVLKLLQIMTAKGLVERDEDVRPQVYHARYTRQQTQTPPTPRPPDPGIRRLGEGSGAAGAGYPKTTSGGAAGF